MKEESTTVYVADDGTKFLCQDDCVIYERRIRKEIIFKKYKLPDADDDDFERELVDCIQNLADTLNKVQTEDPDSIAILSEIQLCLYELENRLPYYS